MRPDLVARSMVDGTACPQCARDETMQPDLAGRRELQPDRRSCASCLDAAARDIEICVPSQRGASFCDHAEDFSTERATSSPVGEARAPRERPIQDLWRIPRSLLEAAGCRVRRWCRTSPSVRVALRSMDRSRLVEVSATVNSAKKRRRWRRPRENRMN